MNRIKESRNECNLSLRQLQKFTSIDFSRIAVIEKNDANIESKTAEKLASFFRVSVDYLLGRDGFIFYYDERNKRFFPLLYEQFKGIIKKDYVTISIEEGKVKRIISSEGYRALDEYNKVANESLKNRIEVDRICRTIDEADDYKYRILKERIIEILQINDERRKL